MEFQIGDIVKLKKAHPFWKYLILGFGGLMGLILMLLL